MKKYSMILVLLGTTLCKPVPSPQEELLFKPASSLTREEAELNKLLRHLRERPLGPQESAGSFRNRNVSLFAALEKLETKLRKRYDEEKDVIKRALARGADVNARDNEGRSLVEVALLNNKPVRFIKLLLDSGAHVTSENKETALKLCLLDRERGIFLEQNAHAAEIYLGTAVRSRFNPRPRSCLIYSQLKELPEYQAVQPPIEAVPYPEAEVPLEEYTYGGKGTAEVLGEPSYEGLWSPLSYYED
jgi:hypothetical protein